MRLYSVTIAVFMFMILAIQPGMKFKETFTLDLTIQPGIRIYDTGDGWMFSSSGSGRFQTKIVSITDSGGVTWQKTFAYPAVSLIPDSGGAMLLDEYGNFYQIDNTGTIVNNLSGIVAGGRNVMARSSGEVVYASGGDNSITCFLVDGNVEWMTMTGETAMGLQSVPDGVVASSESGSLEKYGPEGDLVWAVDAGGFSVNSPVILQNGNFVYGMRSVDGKKGKAIEITPTGKIKWQTELVYGVDSIFTAGDGYLAIGPLNVSSLGPDGKVKWEQSFEGSKKIYPMGFNEEGLIVLGILRNVGKDDILKLALLDEDGKISTVCEIPLRPNMFVNVSRRDNLVLVGLKDKTVIFRLLTMKEYIEGKKF